MKVTTIVLFLEEKKQKKQKMHAKHNEEIKTFSDTAEKIHSSS